MNARFWKLFSLALIAAALAAPQFIQATGPDAAKQAKTRLAESFGKIPLHFEANRGQMDPKVRFLSRGKGYSLFLTPEGAVLSLRKASGKKTSKFDRKDAAPKVQTSVIRMKLIGANGDPEIAGREKLVGRTNYFTGKDSKKWRTNIPNYRKVEYKKIYPGVDLVYYGNQRRLEYDFVVAPGADYKKIGFSLDGAEKIALDKKGNLVLSTKSGKLIQKAPYTYQMVNGARKVIESRYVLDGNKVTFEVASYDKSKTLIIDPVLEYYTYFGGSSEDRGFAITVDRSGNIYIAGFAGSVDFPVTSGALQPTKSTNPENHQDGFIVKLNSASGAIEYATFLGGSKAELPQEITTDDEGNVYLTGYTYSLDYPVTAGAFQTSAPNVELSHPNGFVTKLDPTGQILVYSTYIGGSRSSKSSGIVVDGSGNAYIVGQTYSTDFPVTPGVFQEIKPGPDSVDSLYVMKLNADGSAPIYSTYLGGSRNHGPEESHIAVDRAGNAYIGGYTNSEDFPVTPGAFQTSSPYVNTAFVTKLNPTGSSLVYSTFLGGSRIGAVLAIDVDSSGHAYVAGLTRAYDFPVTPGAFQTVRGGTTDSYGSAFVTKLDPAGASLVYSTYLGGSSQDSIMRYHRGLRRPGLRGGGHQFHGLSDGESLPGQPCGWQN